MKNTLGDLNNHLFAQLERLGEEELQGEKLQEEINRSRAITDVAKQIIDNGSLVLSALKIKEQILPVNKTLPEIFIDRPGGPKKLHDNLKTEYGR